jgi:hypothetical protein
MPELKVSKFDRPVKTTVLSFEDQSKGVEYMLGQDQWSGIYFLQAFVGTMKERVPLLLSTMADDDAISYDMYDSGTSFVDYKPEKAMVGLNFTKNATDTHS